MTNVQLINPSTSVRASFVSIFDWLILALMLIAIVPVLTLVGASIRPGAMSQAALSFKSVNLGTVKPGETGEFAIAVLNRSRENIQLLPPRASCGCISGPSSPLTIKPGGETAVKFVFRAPGRPGMLNQQLTFSSEFDPSVRWVVDVAATIAADIWAEPIELQMHFTPGESSKATLTIHRRAGLEVTDFLIDSDEASVLPISHSDSRIVLQVLLTRPIADGASDVRVRGADGNELLTIPIHWEEKPPFICHPKRLMLSNDGASSEPLSQKLIIYSRLTPEEATFQTVVLVPWIKVIGRVFNDSAIVLDLRIDVHAIPNGFAAPIIRFSTDRGATWYLYEARVVGQSLSQG